MCIKFRLSNYDRFFIHLDNIDIKTVRYNCCGEDIKKHIELLKEKIYSIKNRTKATAFSNI
jgi:hypothetical protein